MTCFSSRRLKKWFQQGVTVAGHCCDKPQSKRPVCFWTLGSQQVSIDRGQALWKWKVHLKPPYEAAFLTNPEEICTASPPDLPRQARKTEGWSRGEGEKLSQRAIHYPYVYTQYILLMSGKSIYPETSQELRLLFLAWQPCIFQSIQWAELEEHEILYLQEMPGIIVGV